MQADPDVRALQERGDKGLQEVAGHGGQGADAQDLGFRFHAVAQQRFQGLAAPEDFLRVLQHLPAGGGEQQAPAAALEQRTAHRFLQLADLGGQGGLRHMQGLGHGGETVAGSHLPEVVEVTVVESVHAARPCRSIKTNE